MPNPHHLLLLVTLLADGGTRSIQHSTTSPDAGTAALHSSPNQLDAGIVVPPPAPKRPDAGTVAPKPGTSTAIPWPEEELAPLATLDGPAVLAAHAALQQVMKRFPKEYTRECAFSPKSLEIHIGYQAGWYFIRIDHRVDKCPGFGPGFSAEFDWFELYAYSPEGRLERYPYMP